jgi:hypothetical protein
MVFRACMQGSLRLSSIPFFNFFFNPARSSDLTAKLLKQRENVYPVDDVLELLHPYLAQRLDDQQKLALRRAMTCPFSSITGLPGAGKTETLASAIALSMSIAKTKPIYGLKPLVLVLGKTNLSVRLLIARYLTFPGMATEPTNVIVSLDEIKVDLLWLILLARVDLLPGTPGMRLRTNVCVLWTK